MCTDIAQYPSIFMHFASIETWLPMPEMNLSPPTQQPSTLTTGPLWPVTANILLIRSLHAKLEEQENDMDS